MRVTHSSPRGQPVGNAEMRLRAGITIKELWISGATSGARATARAVAFAFRVHDFRRIFS
jgi:hypothetical protein